MIKTVEGELARLDGRCNWLNLELGIERGRVTLLVALTSVIAVVLVATLFFGILIYQRGPAETLRCDAKFEVENGN